jgi:hypothetical protein
LYLDIDEIPKLEDVPPPPLDMEGVHFVCYDVVHVSPLVQISRGAGMVIRRCLPASARITYCIILYLSTFVEVKYKINFQGGNGDGREMVGRVVFFLVFFVG